MKPTVLRRVQKKVIRESRQEQVQDVSASSHNRASYPSFKGTSAYKSYLSS